MDNEEIQSGVLAEGEHGTGEILQEKDGRDLLLKIDKPFDWELGFSIELLLGYRATCKSEQEFFGHRGRNGWGVDRYREIVEEVKQKGIAPFKIPIKNQGVSASCTGQALGYYVSVLNFIENGVWVEISARDIYAYISLGEGVGAYLRDALKLVCDRGVAPEELVPVYHKEVVNGREFITPYNEKEYLVKPEETEALKIIRRAFQGKHYRLIASNNGRERMEQMAWGNLLGFGCYFAVDGENNGTWTSEYPKPPKERKWGHALYSALCENYETGFPNSWGNIGRDGWQRIKEDYFLAGAVNSPWTLIDKENEIINNKNMDIIKFLKENDKAQVRNVDTGGYGVIYAGKLMEIKQERAGLYMVDRDARGLIGKGKTISITNAEWEQIKAAGLMKNF